MPRSFHRRAGHFYCLNNKMLLHKEAFHYIIKISERGFLHSNAAKKILYFIFFSIFLKITVKNFTKKLTKVFMAF